MSAAKVCQEKGLSGLSVCTQANNAAAQACAEACSGSGGQDPCAGICVSKTTAPQSGTCPSPDAPISGCPDGANCQWTGCIEAGGQYSLLYNECDVTQVPDECKACDCNCHNDCPPCYLCGSNGECYLDPTCKTEPTSVTITTLTRNFFERYYCAATPCDGRVVSKGENASSTSSITISYSDYKTRVAYGADPGRPCDDLIRYVTAGGKAWYDSGFRGIGGPVVINTCPGGSYDCPACNGDRISTWQVYSSTYEFTG